MVGGIDEVIEKAGKLESKVTKSEMSNALFNFELVTPEKILMSDSVSSVSVSGVEGDMTVLVNPHLLLLL